MLRRLIVIVAIAAWLASGSAARAEANVVRVAKYNALDHLTVSRSHPDATAAMLGGQSEITANFSSAPFQYRQMKNPNIHRVLNSTELFDEPMSFNIIA